MNIEQGREVSHAAHDSLFAMIVQLQMPHTAVCQVLKLVDLYMWILFMWYQNMKASCLVVFRDEESFETTAAMFSRERRTNSLMWVVM